MAVLRTNEANCRDCYACVRACPVKAIRVNTGHAEVVPELCILDGSCLAACPQNAKQVEEHVTRVSELLVAGKVAFSIAPSCAASFTVAPGVLVAALRRLGAVAVAETAETAGWVSRRHQALANEQGAVLSSSCPAIVNLVTMYYPGVLPYLANVVSPMIAHGRAIKKALGPQVKVVFVGPCIAKKEEMAEAGLQGSVDAVLTFVELEALLHHRLPGWEELPAEPFDKFVCAEDAPADVHSFPLPGGMEALLEAPVEEQRPELLVITGVEQCMELLADIPVHGMPAQLVELMACPDGCVSGPAMVGREPVFRRRQRVQSYTAASIKVQEQDCRRQAALRLGDVPLERQYADQRPHLPEPTTDEIKAILASIGKFKAADELNCGACGYTSCQAKAVAVYRGMAEREMCIPYMRSKAESMAEVTISATPTGVVVVNRNLYVLAVNPAAEKMFACSAGDYVGRPLWRLFDPVRVEQVFHNRTPSSGVVRHEKQGLVVQEYLAYDARNDLVIALLTDITAEMRRREEYAGLREATLARAQEVIDTQMRVAQEIAGLLGETTADTKAILTQLMRLFKDGETTPPGRSTTKGWVGPTAG